MRADENKISPEEVRQIRTDLKMSMAELAKTVGVTSRITVWRWETKGKFHQYPKAETVWLLRFLHKTRKDRRPESA